MPINPSNPKITCPRRASKLPGGTPTISIAPQNNAPHAMIPSATVRMRLRNKILNRRPRVKQEQVFWFGHLHFDLGVAKRDP